MRLQCSMNESRRLIARPPGKRGAPGKLQIVLDHCKYSALGSLLSEQLNQLSNGHLNDNGLSLQYWMLKLIFLFFFLRFSVASFLSTLLKWKGDMLTEVAHLFYRFNLHLQKITSIFFRLCKLKERWESEGTDLSASCPITAPSHGGGDVMECTLLGHALYGCQCTLEASVMPPIICPWFVTATPTIMVQDGFFGVLDSPLE